MIQMYNVSKIYDTGIKALSDITLQVNKGEFVFLVGTSGAGKSTLAKMIYKEEEASRGQIIYNGKNINRMKRSEIPYLRRSIGVVFQDFKLLPNKTVEENVAFALEVTEASRREIKKSVPNVLQLVGLAEKALMMPDQLSGGEQQRVCLARAIINNPPLIIADEPTGNLDPDTSMEIVNLLHEINRRGTTIIMATHDHAVVDLMRKRVIALENGRIIRDEERGAYGNAI